MLSPLLVINYRSHCEHFALELFSAGEMASESRWHVLWIKRKMASVMASVIKTVFGICYVDYWLCSFFIAVTLLIHAFRSFLC